MMSLNIRESHIDVCCGHRLAGRYRHRHAYKPHVHPLKTPGGHTVSLDNPHDHRHHRGLFYSLRFADCNFFEERETYGVQRHVGIDDVVADGDTVGFTHLISWRRLEDDAEYLAEHRSVSCTHDPAGRAFVWTWREQLEARRDLEVIKSQWSVPDAEGTPINYHGMCLRLRRDFGGPPAWFDLTRDGQELAPEQCHGRRLKSITWTGRIDGTLPTQHAAVTFNQQQDHTLFLLHQPFGFLSMGPSNLEPMRLAAGQTLDETYRITVADAD